MALEQAGGKGILLPDSKRSAVAEAERRPEDMSAAVQATDSQTRPSKVLTESGVKNQTQQVCHMHMLLSRVSALPHSQLEKVCCCLQVI